MKIELLSPAHAPLVEALNERLRSGGVTHQLAAHPTEDDHSAGLPNRIVHENYVAVDGDFVRGGYTLVWQEALVAGQIRRLAFLQIPLSEGIIERKYAPLGLHLLKDAMSRAPLLFGLGMGGFSQPLPKLLRVLKFHVADVRFFVRVQRAGAFLRNARALNRRPLNRAAAHALAYSGLGQIGASAYHAIMSWNRPQTQDFTLEIETEFGPWLDEIWRKASPYYSMIVVRDRETLRYWYSKRGDWIHFLAIRKNGQYVGWAVVGDAKLNNHNHLGDARLGSLIDCLAIPGLEAEVASLATSYLAGRGVDIIISNQNHPTWCGALERTGYKSMTSNYLIALSPTLHTEVAGADPALGRIHVTRGDGDAAYNLS
jgi:hypothetical protein